MITPQTIVNSNLRNIFTLCGLPIVPYPANCLKGMYPYALIGNCNISAMVSREGSLDWLCLPRPDSEPVFGRLLDRDGGHFAIESAEGSPFKSSHQYYLRHTNILVTEIEFRDGAKIRITDFAPRFEQFGRIYRPLSINRIVEPIVGCPTIKIKYKPITGWNKQSAEIARGNSHLRSPLRGDILRLSTTIPLTYLINDQAFRLTERNYFVLSWAHSIQEDLTDLCETHLRATKKYWENWVKHCSIPTLYQSETIRSALALKLHCFEDTGAILAASTTSLPEEWGGTRNWDYRLCWMRDSYFSLSAFHQLGHYEEVEAFLKYLLNIVSLDQSDAHIAPVYSLSMELPLPEHEHALWNGYQSSSPIRSNNQAADHTQNDVYGELILTLTPIYLDERLAHLRSPSLDALLDHLVAHCDRWIGKADAGLWELRDGWREHTFTNLMCWTGLDRACRLQAQGLWKSQLSLDLNREAEKARNAVLRSANNGYLGNGPDDPSPDSSLALAAILGFPDRDICRRTVEYVQQHLGLSEDYPEFFYRYRRSDDFGQPQSSFVVCSFWVAQALATLGDLNSARKIIERAKASANHVGLIAEHFDPKKNLQLGNFPQAYSHVGMINSAFAASPSWQTFV